MKRKITNLALALPFMSIISYYGYIENNYEKGVFISINTGILFTLLLLTFNYIIRKLRFVKSIKKFSKNNKQIEFTCDIIEEIDEIFNKNIIHNRDGNIYYLNTNSYNELKTKLHDIADINSKLRSQIWRY